VEVDVASFGTEDGITYNGVPQAAYFSQLLGRGSCSEIGAWSVHYGVLKPELLNLLGRKVVRVEVIYFQK
jgi:hypothetical protein